MAIEHVVLVVHGIRDFAHWAHRVKSELESDAVTVKPIGYGYFDVYRFLAPFSWFREPPRTRVEREIRAVLDAYPGARLSIICHSFGSYLVTKILETNPDIRVWRLILCGSVVPDSFRWDKICSQIGDRSVSDKSSFVLNECGSEDHWPVLAKAAGWCYGASGTFGFLATHVTDRGHDGGHGVYLRKKFASRWWRPFLYDGAIKPTEVAPGVDVPRWIRYLGLLPLRLAILAAHVAVLLLTVFLLAWLLAWLWPVDYFSNDPLTRDELVNKVYSPLTGEVRGIAERDLDNVVNKCTNASLPVTGDEESTSRITLDHHCSVFFQGDNWILKLQTYPLDAEAQRIRDVATADDGRRDAHIIRRVYGYTAAGGYKRIRMNATAPRQGYAVAGQSAVSIVTLYPDCKFFERKNGKEPIGIEIDDLCGRVEHARVFVGGRLSKVNFASVFAFFPSARGDHFCEITPAESPRMVAATDIVGQFQELMATIPREDQEDRQIGEAWDELVDHSKAGGELLVIELRGIGHDLLLNCEGEFVKAE